MRLKPLLASLPPPLLPLAQLLLTKGFTQSDSLIFEPPTLIVPLLEPDSAFTLKDVEQLQSEVAKLTSPAFQRGDVLLDAERISTTARAAKWAGAGEKGIDGLLVGMSEGGGAGVVEISGEESEIRRLVCLHAVMSHLIKNVKSTALWIDTVGDFQVDQALAVLEIKHAGRSSESVLDRLEVVPVFDLATFSKMVSDLQSDLPDPDSDLVGTNDAEERRSKGITLLVVDSISALYGEFATASSGTMEGQASLVAHLHHLATLSRSYPLLTILTNDTVPNNKAPYPFPSRLQKTNSKPALENLFAHLTDLTLWLGRPVGQSALNAGHSGAVVVAQVLRSRIGRAGTFSAFWTNGITLETYTAYV